MFIFKIVVLSVVVKHVYGFNNFTNVACGKRNFRAGKIVGGYNAIPHEFPWMASLSKGGSHFCGGTLIADRHILTAGHCLCTGIGEELISPKGLKIVVAQHDLELTISNTFEMGVEKIIIHPAYSCDENEYTRFSNIIATVAGWGWTDENRVTGRKSKVLQKAKVNIFDNNVCQTWYKSQGKKTKILESQICAGYEHGGVDACWADSGGPLMVETGDLFVLVGVVSTGIGCARPRLPGLYTRISEYIHWIKSTLRS
ncbi:hypothetical protein Trydic_g6775 [Trypoxylus dichotomus]